MTPEQINALLASVLLKNQDQGPNWVEIGSFVVSCVSLIITAVLTWRLVNNDNARSLRELEAHKREEEQERRAAQDDAYAAFASSKHEIDDIKIAIDLRRLHPRNHYAILRGYESIKYNAQRLLLDLALHDPNGHWPTPEKWAEVTASRK